MSDYTILQGDCRERIKEIAAASIDSVVCDPPYELNFMSKNWDNTGIAYNVDVWREVYRVLKPGAYLLAFGGSRTYHRMACAIEDAGFEIRDQIQWIYGSGFPKSLDVSKAIDKMHGAEREVVGINQYEGRRKEGSGPQNGDACYGQYDIPGGITAPATDDAKTWSGFGTALKPAHEPICMARKPLEKGLTVAQNVLKWGTGAINIDGCRIEMSSNDTNIRDHSNHIRTSGSIWGNASGADKNLGEQGRFPANVIHDGSDEVEAGFPQTTSGGGIKSRMGMQLQNHGIYGKYTPSKDATGPQGDEIDSGSAARFFYSAKASKYDREAGLPEAGKAGLNASPREGHGEVRNLTMLRNHHPTVKPTDLMQYLCRLVTPPGGLILDPFLGSGSTAKAALIERFRCIGIELNPEYADIARARLTTLQVKLF